MNYFKIIIHLLRNDIITTIQQNVILRLNMPYPSLQFYACTLVNLCIKFYFELLSIRHIFTNYFAILLRHVIATNERLTQLLTACRATPIFQTVGTPSHLIPTKLSYQLKCTVFLHKRITLKLK